MHDPVPMALCAIDEPHQKFDYDHFMLKTLAFCGGGHSYSNYTFLAG
jgi:hypothetical protein